MSRGAALSVTDQRRAARHSVDHVAFAEHRRLGDIKVHIINMSANGFMTEGELPIGRGERITVRFPTIGNMEAHLIWLVGDRAGFQLERVIRQDEFLGLVEAIKPNSRLRRYR